MNNNGSFLNVDNMRIEIAILQENIKAFSPTMAKFRIPAIMTDNTIAYVSTSSANIQNKRNGNLGASAISIDNGLSFYVPFEYTFAYGSDIVPSGTKFIVAFVGANINDAKIIGRYDQSDSRIAESIAKWIIQIINLESREQNIINYYDNNNASFVSNYNTEIANIKSTISQNNTNLLNKISQLDSKHTQDIQQLTDTLSALVATTKEALEEQISSDKTDLEDKINAAKSELSDQIDTLRQSIEKDIDDTKSELNSNISQLREEYLDELRKSENNILGITDHLSELITNIESKIGGQGTDYDSEIESLREAIQARINADNEIIDLINSVKQFSIDEDNRISAAANTKISNLDAAYKAKDEELSSRIDELRTDHNTLSNDYNEFKESVPTDISTAKSEAVQEAKDYTDEQISTESTSIRAAFKSADDALSQAISNLDSKISILLYGTFTDGIKEYVNAEIEASNRYTDNQIVAAKQELKEYVDRCIAEINTAIDTIYATINAHKTELETLISTKEDSINKRIDSEVETLVNKINTDIAASNERSDNALTDATDSILEQLTDLHLLMDENLTQAKETIMSAMNKDNDALQVSIDSVRADAQNNDDALRDLLLGNIETVRDALDNKINIVRSNLEQTIASLRSNIDAQNKEFKTKFNEIEEKFKEIDEKLK